MPNEKKTDLFISRLLDKADIPHTPNGSDIKEIQEALKTASKKGTGKSGFPEFTALSNDFILVIENKAELEKQVLYEDEAQQIIATNQKAITDYAENGALHYAQQIVAKTAFKKVFAFGCSGNEKHHNIRPIFVDNAGYKLLDKVENFENFKPQNIEQYYKEQVLGETPPIVLETQELLKKAAELHEALRNYGQLGDKEKPLVVSAILLALCDDNNFKSEMLKGDNVNTDGNKIYESIKTYMVKVQVSPEAKKDKVLNQFIIVKDRTVLNEIDDRLQKTPLKYFTEFIEKHILHSIKANVKEDVLGRFYGEFMRYSGGDGQSLGVVLTPDHIAELFCDLAQLKPTDHVFDPCCGTATFLIAAMHRMEKMVETTEQKKQIKSNQLHGIEIREDMFSIATTNMILRDDGKSNLIPANFLSKKADDLRQQKYSVGLMNPPYSQAKGKDTAHLSEICFIEHLLNSLDNGGRCVVIVPQSTMVGKTKEDKKVKQRVLETHTLEGVITLNKNTFYGIGTNPCIAVFTAHQPHNPKKYCKFVNYEDDGFVVGKHIGLVETARANERKTYLLDCWLHDQPTETKFMVRTTIQPDDEWLHSFYYFNDEIPKPQDFEKTIADYLTFEFSMIMQGRDYLFDQHPNNNEKKKPEPQQQPNNDLKNVQWGEFEIGKLFSCKIGQNIDGNKVDKKGGKTPYITRKESINGLDGFINSDTSLLNKDFPVITIGNETAQPFVQSFPFYTGTKVNILKPKNDLSRFALAFIAECLEQHKIKYSYSFTINSARLKKQKILLPLATTNEPDYAFMEGYMQRIEQAKTDKFQAYIAQRLTQLQDAVTVQPLAEKEWGEFVFEDIFSIKAGKRLIKTDMTKGLIPFIGASDSNNGITNFVSNTNSSIDSNVLGVNYNGSVVENFYHPYKALFSDDVKRLSLKEVAGNRFLYLFIKVAILKQKSKFQYAYKFNEGRMLRQKLLLPLTATNEPDYAFMEAYMRRIELEKLRAYITRKTV